MFAERGLKGFGVRLMRTGGRIEPDTSGHDARQLLQHLQRIVLFASMTALS